MKKLSVLVMLTTGLFAYGNNQYQNNNPNVLNLYCLVTSFTLNGIPTHVNDRNRKQYKLNKYFQFIATQSYFYPQGKSRNPALFSGTEPGNIDVYINESTGTYNYLSRQGEYRFLLNIQVLSNTNNNSANVMYDCTTNP